MHRFRSWTLDPPEYRTQRNRLLPIEGGDGSTLNLDFTTGVLDPRLTFTRASTATYINSQGYVTTMAAAPTNDPTKARFDYDPTTLAPRGLLIEGTATNLVTYSDLRTTGWAGINATGTNDNATAPDNTTTATLWTGTSGGINRAYSAGFSVTSGTTYTISAWVKKPSSNAARYAKIDVRSSIEGLIGWPSNGTLDLDTGTISGTGYTVTPYQNGWYRIVSTGTVNSTTTARMFVRITDASGGEVTVTTALLWWGAQVETGSGASSYLPTGASQGTRNADNCSIVSPNFAPWYGSPTGWTIVADMTPQSRAAGSFPGMLALRSAADSGLRIYYYNDGTYNTAFRFATASTGVEVYGPNGVTYGVPRKFGASVTSGTQFASSAGVQIGSTQTLAVPMDQTLLAIGSDGVSPTPVVNCRMHFRSIKYWPYAMTLADLNARTT